MDNNSLLGSNLQIVSYTVHILKLEYVYLISLAVITAPKDEAN